LIDPIVNAFRDTDPKV
jgi:hypothetical protein